MNVPTVIGPLPDLEPIEDPGGCQFAGWDCDKPAEVQVLVPELSGDRLLCRGHVGFYMLASASDERLSHVLVRRLTPLRGVVGASLVRAAS